MNNLSHGIKKYKRLRTVVLWAGWLGVIQSAIWIVLTILAILGYNCVISITDKLTYGSLFRTVLYDLYFHGQCQPNGYQSYDNTILKSVATVLQTDAIFIVICVYLGIAICWLLASVVLLVYFSKDHAKQTIVTVLVWAVIALVICLIDFVFFVFFTIDFSRFNAASDNYNFNSINAGVIDPNAAQLLAASFASFIMMAVALKGYVLWLLNAGLIVTLIVNAVRLIRDDGSENDSNDSIFEPQKATDILTAVRPPINGYEIQKAAVYVNDAFVGDNQSMKTVEVNQDSLARAAHMSREVDQLEYRFRSIESFQQYPPAAANGKHGIGASSSASLSSGQTSPIIEINNYPAPDYSPHFGRANGMQRSQF